MLRRIASRMAGCTGSVFVFCDIQATSRRCSWANSKLSFDDMDGDLGFRVCEDFTGHIACGRLVPPSIRFSFSLGSQSQKYVGVYVRVMPSRTTVLLREDVKDHLLRKVGPRGLS